MTTTTAVGTTVKTSKGVGIIAGYAKGWYAVEFVNRPSASFRGKDLKPASADPRVSKPEPDIDQPPAGDDPNPPRRATRVNGGKPRSRKSAEPVMGGLCCCGCGQLTKSPKRHFIQGHDARFHGWMRRLANGEEILDQIPADALALMTLNADNVPTTDYDGSAWKA